ncbi:hypothetical protein OR571_13300 [Psychrobacillus sp. NEAU-3TGS]|uniref:hypothetical protein n=1 Tax=Psychrobacillus sp. NEAU-3TGS TaxID=2995412 RepID=UPI0024965B7A|nr:hypothetical protein [Psychrobacillus sp. NEAU-3TGS]MDI2588064.1 hypothetical protein [Psychrobacillus sp. NEAU-3TGS]
MKEKAILFVILNIMFIGIIYCLSLMMDIQFDIVFYLLFSLISLLLVFVNSNTLVLRLKQFILTAVLFFIGIASFLLASFTVEHLIPIFDLNENVNKIFNSFNNEIYTTYVDNLFFSIILILIISYFFYSLAIKGLKKLISAGNYYKWDNVILYYVTNKKIVTAYLTVFLVVFGFLPLIIGLLEFENINRLSQSDLLEIIKLFNVNIFGGFVAAITPYAYLLFEDTKNIDKESVSNFKKDEDEDEDEDWFQRKLINLFSFLGIVLILTAIMVPFIIKNHYKNLIVNYKTIADLGGIGDFIGGTTVTFLTASSVFLLLATIIMQRKEIKISQQSIKELVKQTKASVSQAEEARKETGITNQTMKRQQFESTFSIWLIFTIIY